MKKYWISLLLRPDCWDLLGRKGVLLGSRGPGWLLKPGMSMASAPGGFKSIDGNIPGMKHVRKPGTIISYTLQLI
jgi:hypothetical protein